MTVRRVIRVLAFAASLLVAACATTPPSPGISDSDRNQIEAALKASVDGWNGEALRSTFLSTIRRS